MSAVLRDKVFIPFSSYFGKGKNRVVWHRGVEKETSTRLALCNLFPVPIGKDLPWHDRREECSLSRKVNNLLSVFPVLSTQSRGRLEMFKISKITRGATVLLNTKGNFGQNIF